MGRRRRYVKRLRLLSGHDRLRGWSSSSSSSPCLKRVESKCHVMSYTPTHTLSNQNSHLDNHHLSEHATYARCAKFAKTEADQYTVLLTEPFYLTMKHFYADGRGVFQDNPAPIHSHALIPSHPDGRFHSDVLLTTLPSSLTYLLFLIQIWFGRTAPAEPIGHLVTSCNLGDQSQSFGKKNVTHSCIYTHTHSRSLSVSDANGYTLTFP